MYCNIVWGYGHSTQLDNIFVLQKRALKLCMNLPKIFDSRQLFKLTDRLTLSDINLYQIAKVLFILSKSLKYSPKVFQSFYTLTSVLHDYSNRRKMSLLTCHSNLNIRKNSLAVRGPVIWNMIPESINCIALYLTFIKINFT